jgi:hypothetical protein
MPFAPHKESATLHWVLSQKCAPHTEIAPKTGSYTQIALYWCNPNIAAG